MPESKPRRKKTSGTMLEMLDYPALPAGRWIAHTVAGVAVFDGMVRFELAVTDDSRQIGRVIVHELPAILAPASPLAGLLAGKRPPEP